MEEPVNSPPPRTKLLLVLERVKQAYLLWHTYHAELPKLHRYSLGARMDTLFIEIIEAISAAAFLAREEKLPYVRLAARKVDTLKLLCMILWETKSLDIKKYIALSEVLDEVGKMLGGWNGQLSKTRPRRSGVRNEKSCVNRRGVVVVPVVVEPVEVRVPPVAVPDEVTDVEVAVPVAVMCKMPPIPLPIESLTGTVHSLDIYFDFVS